MTCVRMGGAIVNLGGPSLKISSGGKDFYFEFHHYCGPIMETKRGEPKTGFPGKYSPFWDALHFWIKQGKRVEGGVCIFETEMQLVNIVQHFGGRHWKIVSTRTKSGMPKADTAIR